MCNTHLTTTNSVILYLTSTIVRSLIVENLSNQSSLFLAVPFLSPLFFSPLSSSYIPLNSSLSHSFPVFPSYLPSSHISDVYFSSHLISSSPIPSFLIPSRLYQYPHIPQTYFSSSLPSPTFPSLFFPSHSLIYPPVPYYFSRIFVVQSRSYKSHLSSLLSQFMSVI